MITKIHNRSGTIMKSSASDELLYVKEIAQQYDSVQSVITTHTNMKWHINNIIIKFIGEYLK